MSDTPDDPLATGGPDDPRAPGTTGPDDPATAGGPEAPTRLDPDAAAAAAGAQPLPPKPEPIIDTRPYRWAIGIFGLVLVIAFSIYVFVSHGVGTAGVPPGKKLHLFVAPLATSSLEGDANVNPRCDPRHPNPRALNVCGRTPIVLGMFVTGSTDCERQIDAIQAVSRHFPPGKVQFAAVAVQAGHAKAAALVRSHHWTIPVAYDKDGAVGSLYGVAICPMVELAYRGGVVEDRLIGNHWLSESRLAARVRRLLVRQG